MYSPIIWVKRTIIFSHSQQYRWSFIVIMMIYIVATIFIAKTNCGIVNLTLMVFILKPYFIFSLRFTVIIQFRSIYLHYLVLFCPWSTNWKWLYFLFTYLLALFHHWGRVHSCRCCVLAWRNILFILIKNIIFIIFQKIKIIAKKLLIFHLFSFNIFLSTHFLLKLIFSIAGKHLTLSWLTRFIC